MFFSAISFQWWAIKWSSLPVNRHFTVLERMFVSSVTMNLPPKPWRHKLVLFLGDFPRLPKAQNIFTIFKFPHQKHVSHSSQQKSCHCSVTSTHTQNNGNREWKTDAWKITRRDTSALLGQSPWTWCSVYSFGPLCWIKLNCPLRYVPKKTKKSHHMTLD